MSSTIDNKVLSMQFDNNNFEKNVKTSISSLNSLQKAVDSTEASSSMTTLASSTDNVSSRFSALEVVAIGFLTKLGSMAAEVGTNLVSSLSIDQVTAGWEKYAEKTTSVQTIMAATESTWQSTADSVGFTGTQMEFVSDQLEKLNWFTDETSYNFTDMINNIGKFTSNNVDLNTSVKAMEGISTWAALSGQNATSASRAMYNLSQSLGVGAVKLQDWMSIENANMATAQFKQNVLDSAVALGTLTKAEDGTMTTTAGTEVTVENFRSTLSDGWFTSDVLLDVLGDYGNAAVRLGEIYDDVLEDAGVTTSEFLSAVTDYKNGTKDVDEISKELGIDAETLSPLLEELASDTYDLGLKSFKAAQEAKTFAEAIDATKDAVSTKWGTIFENIFGNYEEAKVLWTDLANYLYDVFAGPLDEIISKVSEWKELGGRDALFSNDEENLGALWNILYNISDLIDIIKEAFHNIFPEKTAEDLYNFTTAFQEFTAKLRFSDETLEDLSTVFEGLFGILGKVKEAFGEVFPESEVSLIDTLIDKFKLLIKQFSISGDTLEKIENVFKGFFSIIKIGIGILKAIYNIVSPVLKLIKPIASGVLDLASSIGNLFTKLSDNMQTSSKFSDIVSTISSYIEKLTDRIKAMGEAASNIRSQASTLLGILQSFSPILSFIVNFVEVGLSKISQIIRNFFDGLSVENVFDIVGEGLFVAILSKLKSVKTSLSSIADGIKDVISGVTDSLNAMVSNLKAQSLKEIATAVGILAVALLVMSSIDSSKLVAVSAAASVLIGELAGVVKVLAGSDSENIKGAAKNLMDAMSFSFKMEGVMFFAAGVAILAVALKIISTIDADRLLDSTLVISALIWELVGAFKVMDGCKGKMSGVIAVSLAMVIMGAAFKIFASMDWESILKGLLVFSTVVWELVAAAKCIGDNKGNLIALGVIMIPVAEAMVIMGASFKIFASMDWNSLLKGIVVYSAFISELAVAAKIVGNNKGSLITLGAILIPVATSLVIIGASFKIFASMSWSDILKGIIVYSTVIAELVVAAKVVGENKGNLIAMAACLIAVSEALILMGAGMKILGSISLGSIVVSLVAVAAALAILGVAAKVLAPLATDMLIVTGVLALFGVAILVVGVGLTALSAGLAAFGAAFAVAANGIIIGIKALIVGIIGLIPTIVNSLVTAIKSIIQTVCTAITETLPTIIEAIKTILSGFTELIPSILETFISILQSLTTYIPQLVQIFAQLICGVLDALVTYIPQILASVSNFLHALFDGVAELLGGIDITTLVTAIASLAATCVMLGIVGQLGAGALWGVVIMAAVIVALGAILVGLGALMTYVPQVQEFLEKGIPVLEAIGYALGSFLGNIVSGLMTGLTTGLPDLATNLSDFATNLQPFLDTMQSIDTSIATSALALAATILALTAADLVTSINNFLSGGDSTYEFLDMIVPFGEKMVEFSDIVSGNIDSSAVESAANAGKMLAEMAKTLPNSGGVAGFFAGENDLDVFAEKIVPFGKAMVSFSDVVAGKIDTASVESAANAGKMIAEMADTLPNSGGVLGFFAGENDIDVFAEKIKPFGKAIVQFSDTVAGKVDGEAVEAAANAGTLLSELASSLPNEGGVVSWFTGDNGIDKFAEKMVPFGQAIVDYSDTVTGNVDTTGVRTSVTAATYLVNLADSLSNSGGVAGFFAGNNDLNTFGEQMTSFGTSIVSYSDAVTGTIDTAAILTSVVAGEMILQLANALPNSGGAVSWFAGDNGLDTFGEQIVIFGESIASYSQAVSGNIDTTEILTSVTAGELICNLATSLKSAGVSDIKIDTFGSNVASFGASLAEYGTNIGSIDIASITKANSYIIDLVNVLNYVGSTQYSAASDFKDVIADVSETSVSDFCDTFTGSASDAESAVTDFLDAAKSAISNKNNEFKTAYQNLASAITTAFRNYYSAARNAAGTLASNAASALSEKYNAFYNAGRDNMEGYIDGMNLKYSSIYQAAETLVNRAIDALNDYYDFYDAGKYNMEGYINGMNSKESSVYQTAYNLGKTAYDASKEATKVSSPSKMFAWLGEMNGEGYANGMTDSISLVGDAATSMGDASLDAVNNTISAIAAAIDSDMDTTPVIRPVLDMSEIQNGLNGFNYGSYGIGVSSYGLPTANAFQQLSSSGSTTNNNTNSININVYGSDGMSVNDLANAVEQKIITSINRRNSIYA